MPGMNSGLNGSNQMLVAAFRTALLHQGIIVLLVFAVLAVAWVGIREWMQSDVAPATPATPATPAADRGAAGAEPAWRQLLRIGFGILWIFDGLLQAQPAMAAGLPGQVIEPAAQASPPWVQHLADLAGTAWSHHPDPGGRVRRLDPDRDWRLADRCAARSLVPAGRPGQRRLGAGRLGVRRVLRRDLRPRPDLAVRRARRGGVSTARPAS